jgi:hypothetical protein
MKMELNKNQVIHSVGTLTIETAFATRSQVTEKSVARCRDLMEDAKVNNDLSGYESAKSRLSKLDKFDLVPSALYVDVVDAKGKVTDRESGVIMLNLARRKATMMETGEYDKEGEPKMMQLIGADGEVSSKLRDPDGSLRRELVKFVKERDDAFENNDNIQEFLRSFCSNSKTTFKIPTNEVYTKNDDGTCDVSFNLEVSHKDIGATLESHKDLLGDNKLLQIPA